MYRISFLLLFMTSQLAMGQGVILPKDNYRERISIIDANGRSYSQRPQSNVAELLYNLPPDDSGKFHMTIFTLPNCEQSNLLRRDIVQDPALNAIANWANTFYVDASLSSQQVRVREFRIEHTPTIVIYPPMNSRNFPYKEVYRCVGYNGQAEILARRIMSALQTFYDKYLPQKPLLPGPVDPRPVDPWLVVPDQPYQPNQPWPDLDKEPLPDWANPDKLRTNPAYPPYPEVIVVVDPQGLGERLAAAGLEKLAELARNYVRARFGFSGAKSRVVRLGTPEADPYPVLAIDTPALFITVDGRIVGHITRGVAEALEQFLVVPEAGPEYDPSINALSGILADQAEKQSQIIALIQGAHEKYGFSIKTIIAIIGGLFVLSLGVVAGVGRSIGVNMAKAVGQRVDYNKDGVVGIKDLRDALRDIILYGRGIHDVPPGT